jgi:hypothetical protein
MPFGSNSVASCLPPRICKSTGTEGGLKEVPLTVNLTVSSCPAITSVREVMRENLWRTNVETKHELYIHIRSVQGRLTRLAEV